MIAVLEFGNVGSIINMLKYIGHDAIVTCSSGVISQADHLILPGVGSFDSGMKWLNEKKLITPIQEHAKIRKKPLLGICLGMQLLGHQSEEGELPGLGLLPFDTVKFSFQDDSILKIPHMGWNHVLIDQPNNPIVQSLEETQRYYFVHSYHVQCDTPQTVLMSCEYGYSFAAAVSEANIYGFQFHPEKSHHFGMSLIKNFVERC